MRRLGSPAHERDGTGPRDQSAPYARRVHARPGRRRVSRPRLHLHGRAGDQDRARAARLADGPGLQRLHAQLRAVRDTERLVRRPLRRAADAHAHRAVVVRHDGGNGARRRIWLAGRGAAAVRRGRSRHVPGDRPRLCALASGARARPCLRSRHHDGRARRRAHPAARRVLARLDELALRVRHLRIGRRGMGGGLVAMVPRRSRRASGGQRGRAA